jgi:hypothetical protein
MGIDFAALGLAFKSSNLRILRLEGYTVIGSGGEDDTQVVCLPRCMACDLEKSKNEMKNKLEILGIWDEKNFGLRSLWSVLHCSV